MSYALMFHHLHSKSDAKNEIAQGSWAEEDFCTLLKDVQKKFVILDPHEWLEKGIQNNLKQNETCITFDDNLLSQYSVGKKVLDELGLKAFFFINTGMYHNQFPRIEVYRLFRCKHFSNWDEFYQKFLEILLLEKKINDQEIENVFDENHLAQFSFYTRSERVFRFIRDKMLGSEHYYHVMDAMIASYTTLEDLASQIWMSKEQVQNLNRDGHIIGLHSDSHPTEIASMSNEIQKNEYTKNKIEIEKILGEEVSVASYPCGSSNDYTFKLMNELGIKMAFNSSMQRTDNVLNIPRLDSAYIKQVLNE